jgi:hypothetical protein
MDFLNQYGTILVIIGLVLGAAIYIYGSFKKGKSDIVRQDNADLRASLQDKVSKIAAFEATIISQTDTIKNLREVATQTPEVKELISLTLKQQQVINKQHADVIKQLSDLTKGIANMTTDLMTEISKVVMEFSKASKVMAVNSIAQDNNTKSREK